MKEKLTKVKSPMKLIISFVDREVSNDMEDYLNGEGLHGGIVFRGKGTAESDIADIFGFGIEDKDILACLIPIQKVNTVIRKLREISRIEKDNYGLIFVVDLQSASSNLLEFMNIEVEKSMDKISQALKGKDVCDFDLVVAIIGRGFADYVVSSARDAGATGATILYGRGTADSDKYVLGISLQPEREVVLILVKKDERRKIMQAISDKTTLMEEGRGFCFSIPVSEVYGIKRVAEQKKEQIRKAKEINKQIKSEKTKSASKK